MKVESNRYNTSFTALDLRINRVRKDLGKKVAQQTQIATPELKELAKDMDIYLESFNYSDKSGFHVSFAKLGSGDQVPRKLNTGIRLVDTIYRGDLEQNADIATTIVKKIEELKRTFGAPFIEKK